MNNHMIHYIGNSMSPTLKNGDILKFAPYKDRDIRIGDVILFNSPYGKTPIVHRVVFVDNKGVRTKGDNIIPIDDFILHPNDIIGRVVFAHRGKKEVKILNGLQGQIYTLILETGKHLDMVASEILRPVYRWLTRTDLFRKLFSRWIRIQVVCYKNGDNMEMQLQLGRRIIGRRLPGQNQWHIVRPFKIFVDEATLP